MFNSFTILIFSHAAMAAIFGFSSVNLLTSYPGNRDVPKWNHIISRDHSARHTVIKWDVTYNLWRKTAEGGPIWIKFRRLVQNDMSTAVIWLRSKPGVEFQYGGRLGELHGMSSQSQLPHCRVLPLNEFTVMIPKPHATLQGAVTWRNQCHDRATLHGVRRPNNYIRHIENRFSPIFLLQFGL